MFGCKLAFLYRPRATGCECLGKSWSRAVYEETLGPQASVNLISIPRLTSQIRNSPYSFLSAATALFTSAQTSGGLWWFLVSPASLLNSIHHHSGFSESSPTSHCEQMPHLNSVWLLDNLAAAALLQLFPLPDASTKHLTPVFKSLGY